MGLNSLPRVDTVMVTSRSNNSSAALVPMSVESNAADIQVAREEGLDQLEQLRRILVSASSHACLLCWVRGEVHSSAHSKPGIFDAVFSQVKIQWKPNTEWPFCWICWVPFRRPCQHPPTLKGRIHDPSSCPYQVVNPFSQESSPIIPTLIVLIFCFYFDMEISDYTPFLHSISEFLGITVSDLRHLDRLVRWLQRLPSEPSEVPNSAQFLIAWYKFYLQL